MNENEIRNHPYYEMLVNMGFDSSKIISKMKTLQSDNLEDYLCALTAEPETSTSVTTEPDTPTAVPTEKTSPQKSNADHLESLAKQRALENEERKRKNAEIERRAEEARAARIERERKEKLEKERHRRSDGQKMMETRNDLQDAELKRLAEKRQAEKLADKQAKEAIKRQIEEDKERRRQEKLGVKKEEASTVISKPVSSQSSSSTTRIQLRFTDNSRLQESFSTSELLAAVRLFVTSKKPELDDPDVVYSLTYPRRTFTEEDFLTPLNLIQGVVPSAVIMVERRGSIRQGHASVQHRTPMREIPRSPAKTTKTLQDYGGEGG